MGEKGPEAAKLSDWILAIAENIVIIYSKMGPHAENQELEAVFHNAVRVRCISLREWT